MYLGRVVEQGCAADVIERPRSTPTRRRWSTRSRSPAAGGGGERELLSGELPDATDVPSGCRFHPRCPKRFEPCDRVDPPLLPGGGPRPARRLPAARPRARGHRPRRPRRPKLAERWREIAGPVGLIEPGERNAITDVPGVRVGHSQAESGERTGVTVVAPPALPALGGDGDGQRHGRADRPSSRSTSWGQMETPVYLCGTHAVGTVYPGRRARLRARPGTTSCIPVVGECDDGDMADSRTVTAADVERALGRRSAPRSPRAASAPAPG